MALHPQPQEPGFEIPIFSFRIPTQSFFLPTLPRKDTPNSERNFETHLCFQASSDCFQFCTFLNPHGRFSISSGVWHLRFLGIWEPWEEDVSISLPFLPLLCSIEPGMRLLIRFPSWLLRTPDSRLWCP